MGYPPIDSHGACGVVPENLSGQSRRRESLATPVAPVAPVAPVEPPAVPRVSGSGVMEPPALLVVALVALVVTAATVDIPSRTVAGHSLAAPSTTQAAGSATGDVSPSPIGLGDRRLLHTFGRAGVRRRLGPVGRMSAKAGPRSLCEAAFALRCS